MEELTLADQVKFLKKMLSLNSKQIAFLIQSTTLDYIQDDDATDEDKKRLSRLYRTVKRITELRPNYQSKDVSYVLKQGMVRVKAERYEMCVPLITYILSSYHSKNDVLPFLEKVVAEFQEG
jgi:hypothetical protein